MRKGGKFADYQDGTTTGKGLSSLKASKSKRNEIIAHFKGRENLPSSVMRAKRPRKIKVEVDAITAERSYDKTCKLAQMTGTTSNHHKSMLADAYYISGRGCAAGALSTFPQNIGRSMVLLYSCHGDIVLDPFAGHNSRMDLVIKTGRDYIGCDLSAKFMLFNRKRAKKLRKLYPSRSITLHEGDSRSLPVDDECADFTITSPPYYDIEDYGDEEAQLGKQQTYNDFLKELLKVLKENFRALKKGAYAAWFINDFRKAGEFYVYHADVMRLGKKAGFKVVDLLIVDLGYGIRDCFINQTMKQKILPKRHEYGVIFRKPSD
jgi:DNA modification methylase